MSEPQEAPYFLLGEEFDAENGAGASDELLGLAEDNAALAAARDLMVEFYAAPWNEPDGRTTWCVRRFIYGPDVYERVVVSWHETREQAQEEVELLYGR